MDHENNTTEVKSFKIFSQNNNKDTSDEDKPTIDGDKSADQTGEAATENKDLKDGQTTV